MKPRPAPIGKPGIGRRTRRHADGMADKGDSEQSTARSKGNRPRLKKRVGARQKVRLAEVDEVDD